ncbi:hypothetical protein RUM43_002011 [Polyplax serrata]|uniref:Uncharacterized protein n=1 Tax=Polyplax serrata TaxID=468196 RepID=A0AAN8NSM8_POLSC
MAKQQKAKDSKRERKTERCDSGVDQKETKKQSGRGKSTVEAKNGANVQRVVLQAQETKLRPRRPQRVDTIRISDRRRRIKSTTMKMPTLEIRIRQEVEENQEEQDQIASPRKRKQEQNKEF